MEKQPIAVGDKFLRKHDLPEYGAIRVLAIAHGYAMVRRHRGSTWAVSLKEMANWRRA